MKVLMIVGKDFDDEEGMYPYYRLLEENIEVDIAATEKGEVLAKYHSKLLANKSVYELNAKDYDALMIPGGKAPERLRIIDEVVAVTKEIFEQGKPVAAICHGQQILISAEVLKGKTCTCYPGIKVDVVNAGGEYVDEQVVIDGNLITSRRPNDLPYFMKEFIQKLKD